MNESSWTHLMNLLKAAREGRYYNIGLNPYRKSDMKALHKLPCAIYRGITLKEIVEYDGHLYEWYDNDDDGIKFIHLGEMSPQ